jgi:hypothetical protein
MSEKSIPERLFLKTGYRFLLLDEPPGYLDLMGKLPEDVEMIRELQPPISVIQIFVRDRVELETALKRIAPVQTSSTAVWITYPKGTSGIRTDINRDNIFGYVKTLGMTANTMISIDSTWSALRVKLL